jgi:hypothetical protein
MYTGGSSPSTTATSRPATTPTTATIDGAVALGVHSTYTYGGLKLVVMLLFSDFLQGVGRTTAQNKLDPFLSALASADMVKYVQSSIEPTSVQGIGTVIYTVNQVQSTRSGFAAITGCVDQSKLVQVRKDGTHFVAEAKTYPTLKMAADISPGLRGLRVTHLDFSGSC